MCLAIACPSARSRQLTHECGVRTKGIQIMDQERHEHSLPVFLFLFLWGIEEAGTAITPQLKQAAQPCRGLSKCEVEATAPWVWGQSDLPTNHGPRKEQALSSCVLAFVSVGDRSPGTRLYPSARSYGMANP